MMMKPILIAVALAGSGVLATGMAQAGGGLCPQNRGCIYVHADQVGLLGTKGPGIGLSNVSKPANDETSSWKNRTKRHGAWYYHVNGRGKCNNLRKDSENDHLKRTGDNDELSSWRMNRLCRSR